MSSVTPGGIDGRPAVRRDRRSAATGPFMSDRELEGAIRRLYAEHEAAGLGQPTTEQLFAACGSRSARVSQLRRTLREEGQLPELAASKCQLGGMAQRLPPSRLRERASRLTPYAIKQQLAGRARPVAGEAKRERPWPHPSYGLVIEHRGREKRLGVGSWG